MGKPAKSGLSVVSLVVLAVTTAFVSVHSLAAAALGPGETFSRPPTAGEPPTQPFLRIETGVHTAIINRVSVDASGRLAATVSDDKTIRLWSLPDGKPLGVMRVPIGPGDEGSLYSVSLSPDGHTLAASGLVGGLWDGRPSLFLFDVATQTIKARLPKLSSEIVHLAFSPDGRRLAAAFMGGSGLAVYDATNGRVLSEDHDYGHQTNNWAAFDSKGRLATAASDGFVRLYDANGVLSAKTRLPGTGRAYSVAFSPDDSQLAVGSIDRPAVDVFSAADLKHRFSASVGDVRSGALAAVAWLNDGREVSLAAGGSAARLPATGLCGFGPIKGPGGQSTSLSPKTQYTSWRRWGTAPRSLLPLIPRGD